MDLSTRPRGLRARGEHAPRDAAPRENQGATALQVGGVGGGYGAWGPYGTTAIFGSALRVRGIGAETANPVEAPTSISALRGFESDLLQLDEFVQKLERASESETVDGRLVHAAVRGHFDVNLGYSGGAFASLVSSEEVNTVATSYSTQEPDWLGASLATPTLTGTYDGSQGDDTLTFDVTQAGIVGLQDSVIEVRDGGGGLVDTLTFDRFGVDETQSLSNGLELTLDLVGTQLGDSFTVDVSASVGTSLNPDASFDGVLDDRPRFDAGESVTDGSFEVNGTQISVSAGDSVNDVLDRISSSSAGVTASYDSGSDSIVLTQDTASAASTVTITNDTSGFVSAVKLDDAVVTPGNDPGVLESFTQSIGSIASLAGVSAGTLRIGGVDVAIDPQTDSMIDIIERIEAEAGIYASVEPDGDVLFLGRGDDDLVFESDDSGLLSSLGVGLGSYAATERSPRTRIEDTIEVRNALTGLRDVYNRIMEEQRVGVPDDLENEVRTTLAKALGGVFEDQLSLTGTHTLSTTLGVDLAETDEDGGRRIELDALELIRALRRTDEAFSDLLFGRDESIGIAQALGGAVETARATLGERLERESAVGARLDVVG